MSRNTLIQSGYHFEERQAKPGIITALWVFFTIFFMVVTAMFFFWADGLTEVPVSMTMINVIFIGTPAVFLASKFFMTFLFCHNKSSDIIKFKMLEKNFMPICFCREALKIWQILLIYLVPFILIHALLFGIGIFTGGDPNFIILLFIMEFFMGFDLCLVIYILYIKIRYNPDYIFVNHHVYGVTLYSKTYVRAKKGTRGAGDTRRKFNIK